MVQETEAVTEDTEMQRCFERRKSGGVNFQTSFAEEALLLTSANRPLLIGSKTRPNKALCCKRGFLGE
jgi:hypothetical protein